MLPTKLVGQQALRTHLSLASIAGFIGTCNHAWLECTCFCETWDIYLKMQRIGWKEWLAPVTGANCGAQLPILQLLWVEYVPQSMCWQLDSSAVLRGGAWGDLGVLPGWWFPGEWINAIVLWAASLEMARFGHSLFLLPLLCLSSLGWHSKKALADCQPLSFRPPSPTKCEAWASVHYNLLRWALSKSSPTATDTDPGTWALEAHPFYGHYFVHQCDTSIMESEQRAGSSEGLDYEFTPLFNQPQTAHSNYPLAANKTCPSTATQPTYINSP